MLVVPSIKENVMKPEVNAMLQKVKQELSEASLEQIKALRLPDPQPKSPQYPDFKAMSIMEATKWCLLEGGIDKPSEIAKITGKANNAVYTALWKIRNPKRVKVLQRRAKKAKALKAGITPTPKAKPTKVKKPKIENGLYEDGMETPWRDAIQRRGIFPEPHISVQTNNESELMAENRRLKILVEHYESLLFKGGK
jgi:hypothetical protein